MVLMFPKGKSTFTICMPDNVVLISLCDIPHTQSAINALTQQINKADSKTNTLYALNRWAKLRQYGSMDKIHNQLC